MRTRTLASLLILCGSTAALAQVSQTTSDPYAGNSTTITNDATESDYGMTPNTTMPTDPTATNTTDDTPPTPDQAL